MKEFFNIKPERYEISFEQKKVFESQFNSLEEDGKKLVVDMAAAGGRPDSNRLKDISGLEEENIDKIIQKLKNAGLVIEEKDQALTFWKLDPVFKQYIEDDFLKLKIEEEKI